MLLEPKLNSVYSRDNLPERKDGVYVINLDEYSNIWTHWIEVDDIPEETKAFIGNKNKKTNIFRIQSYDSIMCGYFCIEFIDFMLARKSLSDFTNLFSPDNFKKWWYNFKLFSD